MNVFVCARIELWLLYWEYRVVYLCCVIICNLYLQLNGGSRYQTSVCIPLDSMSVYSVVDERLKNTRAIAMICVCVSLSYIIMFSTVLQHDIQCR